MAAFWQGIPFWAREFIVNGGILILGLFFAKILSWSLRLFSKKVASKTKTKLDDLLISAARKPLFWFVIVLTLYIILNRWKIMGNVFPEWVFEPFDGVVYIMAVLAVLTLLLRIFTALRDWYKLYVAPKTETRFDDEFIPLVDRTFKIILIVLAIIIVLDHFSVDVKGLVAVLGVSSLAVALAAQDTLANMIAGFIIMLDRPFRIGDRIKTSSGQMGDVYEIGLRTTKVRTFDNTLVIIPNAQIVKAEINNLSYPDRLIRVPISIGVAYGSDFEKVKNILLDIANNHPKIIDNPKPAVHFLDFGDSSLNLRLVAYVADYSDQFSTGCELRIEINKRFQQENIEIPFPQQDVHFRNPLEVLK